MKFLLSHISYRFLDFARNDKAGNTYLPLTCRSGVWGTNTYSWLFFFKIIVQETIDFAYLKAGTFLGDAWEITMTNDLGMGIIALQVFEQEEDSGLLSLRTGIGIAPFFIQAAFVADADGMLVVMADMGASHMLRTPLMILAIAGDVPVITAVEGIAFGAMTALQVFESEVLVAACGAAM